MVVVWFLGHFQLWTGPTTPLSISGPPWIEAFEYSLSTGCWGRIFCLRSRLSWVQGGGRGVSSNRCEYLIFAHPLFCFKDGATIHTSNAALDFLQTVFGDRLMTGRRRGGMMDWPANSPDLSVADFWLHGYLKVVSIEYLFFKELSFRLGFIALCQTTWKTSFNMQRTWSTISTTTSRPWLSEQCSRWKRRLGLALPWVGEFLKGGKCEIVSLLLQYIAYFNKWFGRLCWKKCVLGGTSVLSHFSLLGGTSSILRTFLGGTSQKKHPVLCPTGPMEE